MNVGELKRALDDYFDETPVFVENNDGELVDLSTGDIDETKDGEGVVISVRLRVVP